MTAPELPDEIYLGKVGISLPLSAFDTSAQAERWLGGGPNRRLWRAKLTDVTELELADPVPARLVVKQ